MIKSGILGEKIEKGRQQSPGRKIPDTFDVAQFKFIPFVLAAQNLNTVLFSIQIYMSKDNYEKPNCVQSITLWKK